MREMSGADKRAPQSVLRDAITDYIFEHHLQPGDPLPPEHELMDQFQVSRNPLREAMKVLQAAGIVDVRHGYGSFVGDGSLLTLTDSLKYRVRQSSRGSAAEIWNLLQVREALEVGLAESVMAAITDKDLAELETTVEAMIDKASHSQSFGSEDLIFHEILYRNLDNDLINDLLAIFWTALHGLDLPAVRDSSVHRELQTAEWHKSILDALRTGSLDDYRSAMEAHFEGLVETWSAEPAVLAAPAAR